jgi:hypothetical protein
MKLNLESVWVMILVGLGISFKPMAMEFPDMGNFIDGNVDAKVSQWIRLNIDGNRNHPYIIVWISPEKYHSEYGYDKSILLESEEFESLVNLSISNRCKNKDIVVKDGVNLKITTYTHGKLETVCVMSKKAGIEFLTNVISFPQIRWKDDDVWFFYSLRGELEWWDNHMKILPKPPN